ncbi:PREDICTED: Purkinje cell protein 4-like protein 1, partial [Pygoscelis adeliae]|uniref:Purkinje cell protein 4-like protein 1 n=1 Tax=Pygoscelis adeliae TaxID=9238 RepID=UPI0004F4F059
IDLSAPETEKAALAIQGKFRRFQKRKKDSDERRRHLLLFLGGRRPCGATSLQASKFSLGPALVVVPSPGSHCNTTKSSHRRYLSCCR